MAPENETGILALLLALAAALYGVTWLVAGPRAFLEVPAVMSPGDAAVVEVASKPASWGLGSGPVAVAARVHPQAKSRTEPSPGSH